MHLIPCLQNQLQIFFVSICIDGIEEGRGDKSTKWVIRSLVMKNNWSVMPQVLH